LFRYAKVTTNKEYQLADWRIRPLKPEMIKYARRDTHYLLFIYDCLRKDLLESGDGTKGLEKLSMVFNDSKQVSLLLYKRPEKYSKQYYALVGAQKLVWDDCRMQVFTS